MAYSARDELNRYYLLKTGKKYDFNASLDENITKSGLSGGEVDSLRNRTRAYLNAYQQGAAIDNNFQDSTDAINRRMENAEALKQQQEKEIDNAAMREASVAGANYERLKKYLPELNIQSGKANLGVGSSAYTDAYSAYVKALNSSAAEANRQKQSLLDNYLVTRNNLLSEQEEAKRLKNSGEETVRSELSKYLSQADEADDVKNAEVFEAAKKIINSKYDSDYTSEDGSSVIDEKTLKGVYEYIEANATSKEKAMELIKNLNSAYSYLYNESAKKYAEIYAGNDEDSEKIREAIIAIGEYFKNATNSGKAHQIGTQGKTQEQTTPAQNNLQQKEEKIPESVSAEDWKKITSRATEETRLERAKQARRATLAWQEQQRRDQEGKVLRADGEDGEGDVMKGRTYKISYGNESYDYKLWGTRLFDGVLEYDYWDDEFKEKVRAGSYKNGTVVKGKDSYGATYFWVLDDLGTENPRAVKIEPGTGEKKKFLEKYAIDLGGVY